MKIIHICLANFFIDDYSYQENILPIYHKKMGYDVTMIASWQSFDEKGKLFLKDYSKLNNYKTKDDIEVYRIAYRKGILPNVLYQKLRLYDEWINLLDEIAPDVIFVHGCQFMDVIKLVKFSKINNHTRIYVDNHADYINSARTWYSKFLHKIVWRYCAKKIEPFVKRFWGVTPLRSIFLQKEYKINPSKIDTLIMGVDIDNIKIEERENIRKAIRCDLKIEENNIVLISGGKLDRLKGTLKLLDTFVTLNDPALRLVLFGTISSDIEVDFRKYLDRDKRISYVGWISSENIFKYFYAADIAIFPGTHSVLWEQAIGIGLPTIIKKWTGFNHLTINESVAEIEDITIGNLQTAIEKFCSNLAFYTTCAIENIKIFSYREIAKKSIS